MVNILILPAALPHAPQKRAAFRREGCEATPKARASAREVAESFAYGSYGIVSPPNPPHRRLRSIQQIFAHAVSCGFKCAFGHMGENFESPALGVECVLRKVRDERHHAATRFRNTLQNPGVADLNFSPIGNEKPLNGHPCEWAKNCIIGHVFGGGYGLVSGMV